MHMEHTIQRMKSLEQKRFVYKWFTCLFKDRMIDNSLDVEAAVASLSHLCHLIWYVVLMIIFGDFEEFHERGINAFYDSGTVYISNVLGMI